MKTSKIIFISLLSTIALCILTVALDIRINGQSKGNPADIKENKQAIPTFRVLCVNNSSNIEIFKSDSTLIKASWHKDSIPPKEAYTVKKDTLMLSDITGYLKIKIYSNDSLKSILLKKSDINIVSIVSPHMSIDMDRSSLFFNLEESDKPAMKFLKITAKNFSTIMSNTFEIDSLGIILRNSNAYLSGLLARKISGTLSDSSSITTQQPEEIWMKKDSTSNIYLHN